VFGLASDLLAEPYLQEKRTLAAMTTIGKSFLICLSLSTLAFAQANGKLQLHFIDVGQGDAAVLISPLGETVLLDVGEDLKRKDCTRPISYLDGLTIKKIDYLLISHYHFDHIGCIPDALEHFPLQNQAYDRGDSYPGDTFAAYKNAVGSRRITATPGPRIERDKGSGHSVIIEIEALNGDGVKTGNENDLSLTARIAFDGFRAEIGGDLSGEKASDYEDIETGVAPKIGAIDVYKVHHHCSSYSTNETWLKVTAPTIGIVSTGDNNAYHHPAADCLDRLHQAGVKTYWTEHGNGADTLDGFDEVVGNIVVQVELNATTFSVSSGS
jgi:competence protein ComEC